MGDWEWLPLWRPSRLCLKQHGPKKAIVVAIDPRCLVGSNIARMYEGWLGCVKIGGIWSGGTKVYDPVDEYKVGQVVRL